MNTIDELKKLAEAATQGPWRDVPNGEGDRQIWAENYAVGVIYQGAPSAKKRRANAAYIAAASPDTILALIEVAEAAQQAVDDAVADDLDPWFARLRAALEGVKP